MKTTIRTGLTLALLGTSLQALAATDFQACLAGLQQQARQEGISAAIVEEALGPVRLQERVIDADRNQPEFMDRFGDYLGRRVNAARISRGQALMAEHRALLERVSAQYGVPGHYLLALWALETDYGGYFGGVRVFDALATLACDARRSTYFTGELMSALRIADGGGIAVEDMIGSWAGAMGHTQFMPSTYLRHAVDGDGSGSIDLWNSVPDALSSAANLLRNLGWEPGVRWGREVRLPDDFDYALAGRERPRTLSEWRRIGVSDVHGAALPDLDMTAALLVPAGHRGPKFLVYENFHVLMRWNRSEFFALTVGHLADRIAGGQTLHTPPPPDAARLTRVQVRTMQERLNDLGFDSGTPDGVLGPATRGAVRAFQQDRGWVADGQPDERLLEALQIL